VTRGACLACEAESVGNLERGRLTPAPGYSAPANARISELPLRCHNWQHPASQIELEEFRGHDGRPPSKKEAMGGVRG
jgi:hypothetical protein